MREKTKKPNKTKQNQTTLYQKQSTREKHTQRRYEVPSLIAAGGAVFGGALFLLGGCIGGGECLRHHKDWGNPGSTAGSLREKGQLLPGYSLCGTTVGKTQVQSTATA